MGERALLYLPIVFFFSPPFLLSLRSFLSPALSFVVDGEFEGRRKHGKEQLNLSDHSFSSFLLSLGLHTRPSSSFPYSRLFPSNLHPSKVLPCVYFLYTPLLLLSSRLHTTSFSFSSASQAFFFCNLCSSKVSSKHRTLLLLSSPLPTSCVSSVFFLSCFLLPCLFCFFLLSTFSFPISFQI